MTLGNIELQLCSVTLGLSNRYERTVTDTENDFGLYSAIVQYIPSLRDGEDYKKCMRFISFMSRRTAL